MSRVWSFHVDGGCRYNGTPRAIGAACAIFDGTQLNSRLQNPWTVDLSSSPRPTNSRAEIVAVILALEFALNMYDQCRHWNNAYPYRSIIIHSDSEYTVCSMSGWIHTWQRNGWLTAQGSPVANRDLLEEAIWLEGRIWDRGGEIEYRWVPRAETLVADQHCKEALDAQEYHQYHPGY